MGGGVELGVQLKDGDGLEGGAADGDMHVLALLLHDALLRGGSDPAAGSYADFLARALSDANTWPRGLEARYRGVGWWTAQLDDGRSG